MKTKFTYIFLVFCLILSIVAPIGCAESGKKEVNVVVLVEFADSTTPFSQSDKQNLNDVFGKGENSLYNFIYQNTLAKEKIESKILATVKINKSIDYFMPRYSYDFLSEEYSEINPIGYDNRYYAEDGSLSLLGKQSAERFYREQEFIYLATATVKKGLKKKEQLKSLILISSKLNRMVEQNSLFWPHQGRYYFGSGDISSVYYVGESTTTVKQAKVANRSINDYILMPYAFISNENGTNLSTLCHEYMHVLGVPDLYSYDGDSVDGVGEFDIMGQAETDNPNLSLSYVREKMGWLSAGKNVIPITESGEFVLYPTDSNQEIKAYKLILPTNIDKNESFYIEYRQAGGKYSNLLSSGLIIYRVNEQNGYISSDGQKVNVWKGNAYGDKEIYIFRYWRELANGEFEPRDEINKNGICYATVSEKTGYTSFGNKDGKENAISYSDGENTKIVVTYMEKRDDGSVKFKVDMPKVDYSAISKEEKILSISASRHDLIFGNVAPDTTAYVLYTDRKIANVKAEKLVKGKYGKPAVYNTTQLSAKLPDYVGYERYVYVVYKQSGGYSQVNVYRFDGVKNIKIPTIIWVSIAVGVLTSSGVLTMLKRLKSKLKTINKE